MIFPALEAIANEHSKELLAALQRAIISSRPYMSKEGSFPKGHALRKKLLPNMYYQQYQVRSRPGLFASRRYAQRAPSSRTGRLCPRRPLWVLTPTNCPSPVGFAACHTHSYPVCAAAHSTLHREGPDGARVAPVLSRRTRVLCAST